MSVVKALFWNATERRLRAFWRIVLQLALSFALAAAPLFTLGELLSYGRARGWLAGLDKQSFDQIGNILIAPVAILCIYLSLRLGSRIIERRDFSVYGVTLDRRWWYEFVIGGALAAALMALIFGVELGAGWIHVTARLGSKVLAGVAAIGLLFSLVKVVTVGIYEEWISRGLVLRNLAEGLTPVGKLHSAAASAAAVLLSAWLFSVLHVTNPNVGLASLAGIFVIGILLGTGYVTTGRLALPIGFHMAWNFSQGVIFGFPVSGDLEPVSLLVLRQTGKPLFTGGDFGPEGGLVGVAAALLGIAVLLIGLRPLAASPTGIR